MIAGLITEAELAEELRIAVKEAAKLRVKHKWPHVRLGRFNIRYTTEQVAAIVAMETVKPASSKASGIAGQTRPSSRRAS